MGCIVFSGDHRAGLVLFSDVFKKLPGKRERKPGLYAGSAEGHRFS